MTKFISIAIVGMLATVAISAVNGYTLKGEQNQQDPQSQDVTEAHTEGNIKDQFQTQYKTKSVDADSVNNVVHKKDTADVVENRVPESGTTDAVANPEEQLGKVSNGVGSVGEAATAGGDVVSDAGERVQAASSGDTSGPAGDALNSNSNAAGVVAATTDAGRNVADAV